MKRRSISAVVVLVICLIFTSIYFFPSVVSAKELTSESQVRKLAKKQVKGAKITDVEEDEEKGQIVYDVELSKGKKEYNLVYRASDSKLISYEWELKPKYINKGKGKLIGEKKAKQIAKKKVKDAEITGFAKKRSNKVDVYKVKMKDSGKKYELKIHARTGAVLEYEWDLLVKSKNKNNKHEDETKDDNDDNNDGKYIGEDSAKQIALEKAGGGSVIKTKFDMEDGRPVYEIEIVDGDYEYEIEVDAKTGEIVKFESEYKPSPNLPGEEDSDYIGLEKAKQIALEKAGGGNVAKAEFDLEDGQPVYEVEIIAGEFEYEIEVHAVTGKVMKFEKESIYD